MKQEIICMKCAEEAKGFIRKYPGEDFKFIQGDATNDYLCDHCGSEILGGKECVALSVWSTRRPEVGYYKWEPNYIENLKEDFYESNGNLSGREKEMSLS